MDRRHSVFGVAFSAWVLLCTGAVAQETTTGAIDGTVTDAAGGPLAGVTITLTSVQGARTEITDATGHYRFQYLVPGTYGIKTTLQGFNTVERQGLEVRLGARLRVEVVLTPGATEHIEVVGTPPVVDLTTSTTGATISAELMSSVPIGRSFSNALALAPGVVAGGIDAANPSIAGASGLENIHVVDGVNITNPGFGSAGSFSYFYGSLGIGVNYDYIQEIQVKTGGYEPEYGQALGGFVNLVTKTGGNEFKSSLFAYYQGPGLEAERQRSERNFTLGYGLYTLGDVVGFESTDIGFEVSGPIVRDKVFFYGVFDPTFTTITYRTPPAVTELQGIDHQLDADRRVWAYAANVKWLVNPRHTVSVSSFGDPGYGPYGPQYPLTVALADPTGLYSEVDFGGYNAVARWEGELLDNAFVEASFAFHRDDFSETPRSTSSPGGLDLRPVVDPMTGDTLNTEGTGYAGGFFESAANSRTYQYSVKFSNFLQAAGEHKLRYGLDYQDIAFDWLGYFTGPTGIPLPDGKTTGTGYFWFVDPDGQNFTIYTSSNLYGDISDANRLAFFISDTWQPVEWVNLMGGVRYEENTLIGSQNKFTWEGNWAPRVNVSLDPLRDKKSKLSFAYGRFYGTAPSNLAVVAFSTDDQYIVNYPISNVDLSDPSNPKIIGPPDSNFVVFQTGGARVDPESELTYQDEFIVSAEREVMPALSVGVSYMHRRLGKTLENVGLVPYSDLVNGTASVGQYLITNPRPELGFPKPTRQYNAVTLRAEKRLRDRWQLLGSYTWSRLEGNYEGYYRRDTGSPTPNTTFIYDFPYLEDPSIFKHIIDGGVLANDRTHVFNLYGSYVLPFSLNLGMSVKVQTGMPITKLGWDQVNGFPGEIPLEPRGASGRGPTTSEIGLHADYAFRLGRSQLGLIVNVFNVFNQQDAVDFDQWFEFGGTVNPDPSLTLDPCPDCQHEDFGKPRAYQQPRQIQLGLRASY